MSRRRGGEIWAGSRGPCARLPRDMYQLNAAGTPCESGGNPRAVKRRYKLTAKPSYMTPQGNIQQTPSSVSTPNPGRTYIHQHRFIDLGSVSAETSSLAPIPSKLGENKLKFSLGQKSPNPMHGILQLMVLKQVPPPSFKEAVVTVSVVIPDQSIRPI